MAKYQQKGVSKALPLGERQRQYALTVLLRSKEAFENVKGQLSLSAFDSAGSRGYALVWASLVDYHNQYKEIPAHEVLLADVENRLSLTDELSDDDINNLEEFLNAAYSIPADELNVAVAQKYLLRMVTEQAQYSLLNDIQSGVIADLPSLLQQHIDIVSQVQNTESGKAPLPFPENPEEIVPLIIEPTGVSFLDMYMNGGMARGEVNGFCGPYGSCKTTLGIMLAVEGARISLKKWREEGCVGLPQRVYFFSWEEDLNQLRPRVISYAAGINRRSLEGDNYYKTLSKSVLTDLKPYEKHLYKDQIAAGIIQGEYDRQKAAMEELNHCLRIIDFSGGEPKYQRLSGQMVEGIATAITIDQQADKNPGVALVVVDYAGAAAERCIQAGNAQRTDLRHLIGKMPLNVKNLVAAPMNCKSWVLHQLGTEANSRDAGVAPKSTDTAEAKNFFENVNFGFMVGKPKNDGCTVLTNGKQRRAARREDMVIQIDGALSRVLDVSNQFMIENSMILSKAEAGQFIRQDAMMQLSTNDPLFSDVTNRNNDVIGLD